MATEIKIPEKFLKSLGKDEAYCEWFECDECHSTMIMAGANYCSECGVDVRAKMPV